MRAKNDHIVLDAAMRRNITPVQSARNSLESSPHIKFSFRLALLMFEFFEQDFLGKACGLAVAGRQAGMRNSFARRNRGLFSRRNTDSLISLIFSLFDPRVPHA